MHLTVDNETVAMLQEVSILLGEASVNAVGSAILKRECARILNLARKQGVVAHEAHAQRQQSQQAQQQPQPKRSIPVPQPDPNHFADSESLSAALRKEASGFQTFNNTLGPDASGAVQHLQQGQIPQDNGGAG